jgi:hypothetical protein
MNDKKEEQTKVEIKSINVKIGKKDVTLSLDEAKLLQAELNKVLCGPMYPVYQPTYVPQYVPVPVQPQLPIPWWQTTTICGAQGASNIFTDGSITHGQPLTQ